MKSWASCDSFHPHTHAHTHTHTMHQHVHILSHTCTCTRMHTHTHIYTKGFISKEFAQRLAACFCLVLGFSGFTRGESLQTLGRPQYLSSLLTHPCWTHLSLVPTTYPPTLDERRPEELPSLDVSDFSL